MSGINRWNEGRGVVEELIQQRRIRQISPSRPQAEKILKRAKEALKWGEADLYDKNYNRAVLTAYDAAYDAVIAILTCQGLATTSESGHHKVLTDVLEAQFPSMQRTFSHFDSMRETRNYRKYSLNVAEDETQRSAEDKINKSKEIISVSEKLIDTLPVF